MWKEGSTCGFLSMCIFSSGKHYLINPELKILRIQSVGLEINSTHEQRQTFEHLINYIWLDEA